MLSYYLETTEETTNIIEEVTSESFWAGIWNWCKDFLLTSGVRLIGAIILLIVGIKIIGFVNKKVKASKALTKLPINLQQITKNTVKIGLWVVLIIGLAAMIGIEMSSIVATFVSLGLVVGMALEGSLSNLAGGVMLLIFKPFSVGDYISYGGDKDEGIVTDVGLFYTTIKASDARIMQVPNGTLCNKPIVDYSTFKQKRLDVDVVVPYNCDIDMVKETLLDVCNNCERVLQEPKKPKVVVHGFRGGGYEVTMRVWIDSLDFKKARFDLLEAAKRAFDEKGIQIS